MTKHQRFKPAPKESLNFAKDDVKIHHGKVTTLMFYQMDDGTVWRVYIFHARQTHKMDGEIVQIEWKSYWPKWEDISGQQINILDLNKVSEADFPTVWESIKHLR